ncbi:MAG: glycosyltransferase family 2 protein [Fluviicola sp.]|jgi:glycosyltransferase involved in cell wall biosynthesis
MEKPIIDVIIPAHNEQDSIGKVIADIPKEWVRNIIVVSNCSTDNTKINAEKAGAIALEENRKGYGWACLKGMDYSFQSPSDIIVFLDGDYSDYPQELSLVVAPILEGKADLVIGSRSLGKREKKSMTPQQIFGNWLATFLIRIFYRHKFTDLGPFRAIKTDVLKDLKMNDKTYGWTIEMQLKALNKKYICTEVAVNYKQRIGVSKVSGTVKGTVLAGIKIIFAVFKYLWKK